LAKRNVENPKRLFKTWNKKTDIYALPLIAD